MTALYRAPWYLRLARESRGAAWTLHAAARACLDEAGAPALDPDLLELALACLPPRLRRLALRALLAVGLWTRTPAGYQLHDAPSAAALVVPPPPAPQGDEGLSPSARRMRKLRASKRVTDSVTNNTSDGVTSSVTEPVTVGVTPPVTTPEQSVTEAETPSERPVTSRVTEPVTPPSCVPSCALAEEISSSSPSSPQKMNSEERRGEDLPPPPVTPELDPVTAQVAAVLALWSKATGHGEGEAMPADCKAVRARVSEGVQPADFRAAFAKAALDPWFKEGDGTRDFPRTVCGRRFWSYVEDGRDLLPRPSQRQPSGPVSVGSLATLPRAPVTAPPSTPPPPSAPQPAPETLPWASDPYKHPTRVKQAHGANYQPLPEEGIYLRTDLYLARRKAAAE